MFKINFEDLIDEKVLKNTLEVKLKEQFSKLISLKLAYSVNHVLVVYLVVEVLFIYLSQI